MVVVRFMRSFVVSKQQLSDRQFFASSRVLSFNVGGGPGKIRNFVVALPSVVPPFFRENHRAHTWVRIENREIITCETSEEKTN